MTLQTPLLARLEVAIVTLEQLLSFLLGTIIFIVPIQKPQLLADIIALFTRMRGFIADCVCINMNLVYFSTGKLFTALTTQIVVDHVQFSKMSVKLNFPYELFSTLRARVCFLLPEMLSSHFSTINSVRFSSQKKSESRITFLTSKTPCIQTDYFLQEHLVRNSSALLEIFVCGLTSLVGFTSFL